MSDTTIQKNNKIKIPLWFFYWVIILIVAKLVLSSREEMLGFYLPHDDLWQVRAASRWYWGGSYAVDYLYHLPVYPLVIKTLSIIGVPLRVEMELLYCFSCALFSITLIHVGVPAFVAALTAVAIVFHPSSFQLPNRFGAEILLASLLLLALSSSLEWWMKRKNANAIYTAILSGLFWALAWNTRKESVILLPIFIILGLFVAIVDRHEKWNLLLKRINMGVILPVTLSLTLHCIICLVNYIHWGLFASSILTAPGYTFAFKELQSICPEKHIDYIPVTVDVRKKAYSVSPTFALLQQQLEGPVGKGWAAFSKEWTDAQGIKNLDPLEISAGWFYWALYDSAVTSGYASIPGSGDALFYKIGQEIEEALRKEKLSKRFVPVAMIDPDISYWIPRWRTSLSNVYNTFLTSSAPARATGDQAGLQDGTKRLFDDIANRRTRNLSGCIDQPEKLAYWSWRCQANWEKIYYNAIYYLQWIALIGMMLAVFSGYKKSVLLVVLLLLATVLTRVLFFAILDASSWNGAQPRYIFPVMPEFGILIVLGVWLFLAE